MPAFLPDEYVPDVDDRVRFYRRLAGAVTPEGVGRVADELRERFGAMPETARNLIGVARIKAAAAEAGATNVSIVRGRVVIAPVSLTSGQRGRLAVSGAVYLEKDRKATFPRDPKAPPVEEVIAALDSVLAALAAD